MQRILTVLVLLALFGLGGCKAVLTCSGPADIGDGGQSIPPLRVPPGMVEPNQKDALVVPELNEPERPRTKDAACIDHPPSYFPDRPPGAEAPAESNPAAVKPPAQSNPPAARPPAESNSPVAEPPTQSSPPGGEPPG